MEFGMPLPNSLNTLRGHHVELVIPSEVELLVERLEEIGFSRNQFLIQVAQAAIQFANDEDARTSRSLTTKGAPHDPVVCRYHSGMRGRTQWISLRKRQDEWILAAFLFEGD